MRKEKIVTINDRGQNKTFKIKEMSAREAEDWILQFGQVLVSTGLVEKAIVVNDSGSVAMEFGKLIATSGIFKALASLDYKKAKSLYDRLLDCCSLVVNGAMDQKLTDDVLDGLVEDVKTLFLLKKESAELNFDFFSDVFRLITPPSEAKEPQPERRGAKISVH